MRCAGRNRQLLYYATYSGVSATYDEYGNENGQKITYNSPVPFYVNVSAAKNADFADIFGLNLDYDRAIILPTRTFPIDEQSVLWVDSTPDNDTPYNYVVRRVSRSVNSTAIAIKRVDVQYAGVSSNTQPEESGEPDSGTGSVQPESGSQGSDTP